MNQRDRALEIVRRDVLPLAFGIEPGVPAAVRLRAIVAESQNPRPEGHADGSIAEEEWTALRDVANALERIGWLSSRLVSGRLHPGAPAPQQDTEDALWREAQIQWPNRRSAGYSEDSRA